MDTYKLGNQVKCIIRSYVSGNIGESAMKYDNQPYTILKDISARVSFNTIEKSASKERSRQQLAFSNDVVTNLFLSDILLTDKILNLIYLKSEAKLCNTSDNFQSDDKKLIYLPSYKGEKFYQVFIYDNEGQLESAYGEIDSSTPLKVKKKDSNYVICYSFEGQKGLSFSSPENQYFTIDLEMPYNKNDETSTMWMHFEKCRPVFNKTMYFTNMSNTVDLTFSIIQDGENYIAFGE